MAKWADYLISAVKFSDKGGHHYISHVWLHEDTGDSVSSGKEQTKDEVIKLIDKEKTIKTIRWNYQTAKWSQGAVVQTEKLDGVRYLRTHPDATKSDNLDNLLRLTTFGL